MRKKLIAVSGGFDPMHKGHVRMIKEAAQHGNVIVILNSDDWLARKKGYAFMQWEERAENFAKKLLLALLLASFRVDFSVSLSSHFIDRSSSVPAS